MKVDSSASRPLNLEFRQDVSAERQSYQGRDYWVIKDPIALKYFRFEEEEYALLQMINGTRTPDQIKREFDYRFSPQKITLAELYQFIGLLYRSCLLVSNSQGQGRQLRKRGVEHEDRKWKGMITNILAIRFRGIDPNSILTNLDQWFWWLFTWPFFWCILLLWVAAASLLFSQTDTLLQKLPSFYDFFAAENWIWLALTVSTTKIIHEFGHGLACKRFGGQCHEMGVMLLVLTPCLYCNVSDSWTLPSKWKRSAIAAAGMYVELILAALAVFVWWFSQPGLVNQIALNIVFVSSVSTILFNGNPLLRYDGYYILSDLIEIPNLRQKATKVLQQHLAFWALGIESKPDPFLPTRRKWFFFVYSISAAFYRWFITFSIFWFLYSLLEPYGAKIIGQIIALFAVWGLLGIPLIQLYRFFSIPGRFGSVNPARAVTSICVVGLVLFVILAIPIPHYVRCPFILEAADAENIFVEVPGTLAQIHVAPGTAIKADQPIVQVTNEELHHQLVKLQSKIHALDLKHKSILRTSQTNFDSRQANDELAVVRAEYESARSDLEQRDRDVQKLNIAAARDGYLLPPAHTPIESESDRLPAWYGSPIEKRNLGCLLQQGTILARIAPDLRKLQAVIAVDQSDIEFLQIGQKVELFPNSMPGQIQRAQINEISRAELKAVPRALSSQFGGPLITTKNKSGVDIPQSATFLVSAPFTQDQDELYDGGIGKAKINVGSHTIGQRILRLFQSTFRFDL